MPYPRLFGWIPPSPNASSVYRTPASVMIDSHYAQLHIMERWSWDRYVRLCKFLQMTPWEVASLVMIRHQSVEAFKRHGRLVGGGHRSAALVLTLLEAHVMSEWTDDVIKNPFPDFSKPIPPWKKGVFPARKANKPT